MRINAAAKPRGRWRSGQSQQTVNLSPQWLRRFESFPAHQPSLLKQAKVAHRSGFAAKVGRKDVSSFGWQASLRVMRRVMSE